MSQAPDPNSSPPKFLWGKRIERFLDNVLEPIDLVGQRLLGDLAIAVRNFRHSQAN
jgi:hypothetical protein